MLATVGPATVSLVIADRVHTNTEEKRDGEPNQGAPGSVQVFVVPHAGLEPCGDLVQHPHGAQKHGSSVPSLGDHACDDQRNNTGQKGGPIPHVAVVAVFGGDAQLVENLDRIEVPQRTRKGEDGHGKSDDQRRCRTVEARGLAQE